MEQVLWAWLGRAAIGTGAVGVAIGTGAVGLAREGCDWNRCCGRGRRAGAQLTAVFSSTTAVQSVYILQLQTPLCTHEAGLCGCREVVAFSQIRVATSVRLRSAAAPCACACVCACASVCVCVRLRVRVRVYRVLCCVCCVLCAVFCIMRCM